MGVRAGLGVRWWRVSGLRLIAGPFVAAAPAGARVRARLRVSPQDRLPAPLSHLANRPHGRYRLTCPVEFTYRGDEVAAQAMSGAVRYDIACDPARGRWYIDASWKAAPVPAAPLGELRRHPVVAVDLNAGHLAAAVAAADGNLLGTPAAIGLGLAGLPSATRDGRLRAAISALIATAGEHGARAVVIEDLDFAGARAEGRERHGSRPSRGTRGRGFRRAVASIPTAAARLWPGSPRTLRYAIVHSSRSTSAGLTGS